MSSSKLLVRASVVLVMEMTVGFVPRPARAASSICGEVCVSYCQESCAAITDGVCPSDGQCEDNVPYCPSGILKWCYGN